MASYVNIQIIYGLQIKCRQTNQKLQITNYKSITDNSVIFNAVNALLTFAGFDKDQLNVALEAIKNAKDQSLVDKKQDKVYWLEKTFIYEHIDDAFVYDRATIISGRWYFRIYDEKNNQPVVSSLTKIDKKKK